MSIGAIAGCSMKYSTEESGKSFGRKGSGVRRAGVVVGCNRGRGCRN